MRSRASNPLVAQRAFLTRAHNSSFASKLARYGKIEAIATMRTTLVSCASSTLITICGCSRNVSPYSQLELSGDRLASVGAARRHVYRPRQTPFSEALVYHAIHLNQCQEALGQFSQKPRAWGGANPNGPAQVGGQRRKTVELAARESRAGA